MRHDSQNMDAPHTLRELAQAEDELPVKSAWVSTSDTRMMGEEIGEMCMIDDREITTLTPQYWHATPSCESHRHIMVLSWEGIGPVMTISSDGVISFSPTLRPEEAAEAAWNCLLEFAAAQIRGAA